MDTSFRLDDLSRQFEGLARLAGAILGDPDGGQDVAQETLLRALRAERRPAEAHELRPWLHTIARRLAFTERAARRSRAHRERNRDAAAAAAPSTEEIVARAEAAERLHALVRSLTPAHSAVLLARYVGGHSPAEIAERDGVPAGTVKARLRRAKVELRAALDRDGLGTDEHWSIALAPLAALAVKSRSMEAGAVAHGMGLLLGASLMTKIVVPLVVAASAVLGFLFLRSDPAPASPRSAERTVTEGSGSPVPAAPAPVPGEPAAREPIVPAAATSPSTAEGPVARLHGIVTDADGEPLSGVTVQLENVSWVDGRRSFTVARTTSSDEVGHWFFRVPLDGQVPARLRFTGDIFDQTANLSLAVEPRANVVVLEEGDVDVGTVALPAAGVAIGRVVDGDGAPVAGVHIELPRDILTGRGLAAHAEAASLADGTFEIARGPIGNQRFAFRHRGFISRFVEVPLKSGVRSNLGDVTLENAGEVSGVLVDEKGNAIANETIHFDPLPLSRGDDGTRLEINAIGRFHGFLRSPGKHRIRVERDGFEPLGSRFAKEVTVEPGDGDVRIVLEPAARTQFLLVDSVTREPIEAFWIDIMRNGGSGAEQQVFGGKSRGRARSHPGGLAVRDAREQRDRVHAWAPGYLEFTGDVQHDSSGESVQTISLERGATIAGRVFSDGVPKAEVEIHATKRPDGGGRGAVKARTDVDGRYTVEGLEDGTWYVVATLPAHSRSARTSLFVDPAGTAGLVLVAPDMHLKTMGTGTIEGTVILPPNVPTAGLIAYHGKRSQGRKVPVRGDGTFTLLEVPEGESTINLEGGDGLLVNVPPTSVLVPADGVAVATINASRAGAATLVLSVEAPGVDLGNVTFFVEHDRTIEDPDERHPFPVLGRHATPLGTDGRAEVLTRASGIAYIKLCFPDYSSVVLHDQPIELEPGGRYERTVRYVPTHLDVELSKPWLAEGVENLSVSLWTEGQHEPVWRAGLAREVMAGRVAIPIENGRARLTNVPTGRFRLEVVAAGPAGWLKGHDEATIEIRRGGGNRITLPAPRAPR